tara:strand:- start:49 stop:327 length:279 start_codon:yes stop_codon:yes gene_type:complete
MNLKQKLALILGLLFVIGISADPIIHSFEEDEHHHEVHESSDCQVCETESFKVYALKVNEEYASVTNISINSAEDHVTPFSADFSARGPPNS